MKQGNPRRVRVGQAIRDGLASMIGQVVKDPRVKDAGIIVVNHVELNSDMSVAQVYVSFPVLDEHKAKAALKGLETAKGFLRGPLGRTLGLARPPSLRFILDDSADFRERLAEIRREDERRSGEGPDPGDDAVGEERPPEDAAEPRSER